MPDLQLRRHVHRGHKRQTPAFNILPLPHQGRRETRQAATNRAHHGRQNGEKRVRRCHRTPSDLAVGTVAEG